jgi:hypothetical protein
MAVPKHRRFKLLSKPSGFHFFFLGRQSWSGCPAFFGSFFFLTPSLGFNFRASNHLQAHLKFTAPLIEASISFLGGGTFVACGLPSLAGSLPLVGGGALRG